MKCALADASRTHEITPQDKTVKELAHRHGTEIKLTFGIEPKALTYSESQYLLGFKSTEQLRNSVVKARSERSKRLFAKGLSESANDGDVIST